MKYTYINLFFIFAFLGYIWEVIWVSINEKKLTNRGFLRGPILPIYGFGAITVLLTTKDFDNNILIFIIGIFAATILELVTGYTIEKIFKVRYWNYDKRKFNYKGYICLRSSLFWGFLSMFLNDLTRIYIMPLLKIYENSDYRVLSIAAVVVFISDVYVSVRDAYGFRKILEMEERANAYREILRANIEEKKLDFQERLGEIKEESLNFREIIEKNMNTGLKLYFQKLRIRESNLKNKSIIFLKENKLKNNDSEIKIKNLLDSIYKKRIEKYKKAEKKLLKVAKRNKLSFRKNK